MSIGGLLGGLGGPIGAAIVRLELDTKKYQAELNAAHAQTTASTNSMAASTSRFSGAAKTAMVGAGVAVAAFAVVAVKAAIEASEAQLKLQNTFANSALLSDRSVESFTAQADALRDLTGVDDEAVIGAQALLGQFKLTGAQVEELIPLIVDLSTKMGIDLEAAAKAVGKATQGTTGGLQRYGIQVDKTAAATDAFGATLEALGVVQGFAADRADTQPWILLGAQFEELVEQLGTKLLPLLIQMGDAALVLADHLGFLAGPIGILIDLIGGDTGLADEAAEMAEGFIAIGVAIADKAAPAIQDFLPDFLRVGEAAELNRKRVHNFARLTGKELKDLKNETEESIHSMFDDLDGFSGKWELTSREAVRSMEAMAKQAEQMARDFKALDREAIPEKFKAFLLEQGPAAVHAFVTATEKEKRRFIQAWKGYEQATRDAVHNMKDVATRGGVEVGEAAGRGLQQGVENYFTAIEAAFREAILRGLAAAREAADAESPSKKMRQLGEDMIEGLMEGLRAGQSRHREAIERFVHLLLLRRSERGAFRSGAARQPGNAPPPGQRNGAPPGWNGGQSTIYNTQVNVENSFGNNDLEGFIVSAVNRAGRGVG